jgi:hypothetical protein
VILESKETAEIRSKHKIIQTRNGKKKREKKYRERRKKLAWKYGVAD